MRFRLLGSTFRLLANEGSYSECVALVKRGWKDHIDPDQCDALLTRRTRHPHGDPADHNADGRAGRGQRDPLAGAEFEGIDIRHRI